MLRIRVIKTVSGADAVQVVYYKNRKRGVFKHIGSAKISQELESLKLVSQVVLNQALVENSKKLLGIKG